jgi:hypothetical protein
LAGACSTGASAANTVACASTKRYGGRTQARGREEPCQFNIARHARRLRQMPPLPRAARLAGAGRLPGARRRLYCPTAATVISTFDIWNAQPVESAQEKTNFVGHVPGLIGRLCLNLQMMKRQGLPAATHEHNK